MTDKTQDAIAAWESLKVFIYDQGLLEDHPEVLLETIRKGLQQRDADQVTEEVKQLHKLRRDMQSKIDSLEGRLSSKIVDVEERGGLCLSLK